MWKPPCRVSMSMGLELALREQEPPVLPSRRAQAAHAEHSHRLHSFPTEQLSLLGSNCSPTLLFKSRFLSNLTSLCALPASLLEAEELLPSSSLAEHTEVHPKGRRPKHFTLISRDCSKEKPFVSRKSVHTHSGHCWVSNSYSEHLAGSGEDKNKHTSNPQVLPIVPFCQKMFLAQKQLHKSTDGRITAKISLFVSSGRCPYGISAYPKLTCTAPAS